MSGALILFSSQPFRIFTVTGTFTAFLTAFTIFPQSSGVFIKTEPPPLLFTLGAGHPIFMSIMSGLYFNAKVAARAIISGLSPKIWIAQGCSFSESCSKLIVFSLEKEIPRELTISLIT